MRMMPLHFLRLTAVYVCCALILAACGGSSQGNAESTQVVTPSPDVTPLASVEVTRAPTGEATVAPQVGITIWWPDVLYPSDAEILDRQIREFVSSEALDIDVDFRRKRTQDVGGIMSTLRSASRVAPGALPDLTLLRRQDLISAVQDGVIVPVDGLVPAVIIGDLYDTALQLGQVNGQTYGVPYMLEAQILVYSASSIQPEVPQTFDDLLNSGMPFLFPAGRLNGVNDTFYIQYLSAGGTPPDRTGDMQLNTNALRNTLEFYEAALLNGVVDSSLLEYISPADYELEVATGEYRIAVVDTTTYLTLLSDELELQAGFIPADPDGSVTTLSGWMWVVTTTDPLRQQVVADFVEWMMEPERQREFASAVYMLPSQEIVIRNLDNPQLDIDFIDTLLESAVLPLSDSNGGSLARAMQSAFASVLSGQDTALQATQSVLEQSR